MSYKSNSRYLKRKAKLNQTETVGEVLDYGGERYRKPRWAPFVFETELAVYETIRLTKGRLSNGTVKNAFTKLILALRQGESPIVIRHCRAPELVIGDETDFLIYNIRRHWTAFFKEQEPVPVDDLIGVLRTLLFSIKAHQSAVGRRRGYVNFLQGFMEAHGVKVEVLPEVDDDFEEPDLENGSMADTEELPDKDLEHDNVKPDKVNSQFGLARVLSKIPMLGRLAR